MPDDISYWVSLLVFPFCLLKTVCPMRNLEFKLAIKRQGQEESIINAIRSWSMTGGSFYLVRETLAEFSHPLLNVDEVLSSLSVAPYNDDTLEELKTKHPFKHAPSFPHIPINHHHLIVSPTVVQIGLRVFLVELLVDEMACILDKHNVTLS
ncbi:hypothetical protein Tco_1194675 [Tanacetum coccineum]